MNYNPQAIIVKQMVDQAREDLEAMKYTFYNIDDSEGAKLMMENTAKRGFFKARYLNPDALAMRNSLFDKGDN